MIRAESRVLSFKIERMEQQRKDLSEEKRVLKQAICDMHDKSNDPQ